MLLDDGDDALLGSEEAIVGENGSVRKEMACGHVGLKAPETASARLDDRVEVSLDSPQLTPKADPVADLSLVQVAFNETGSLGIEFHELHAPYIVKQIHAGGLASGRGLQEGDLLTHVDQTAVDAMEWDNVVGLLTKRPMTMSFHRKPPPKLEEDRSTVDVTIADPGSLGIEFQELKSPYIVATVHAGGHAHGKGLEKGDLMTHVGDKAVDGLDWDSLVALLTSRPMTMRFYRNPEKGANGSNGMLSGFMRIGGSVAQQGLGFGNAVVSTAATVAGSIATDTAAIAGTAATKAMELQPLDKAKDAVDSLGALKGTLTSNIGSIMSSLNDDGSSTEATQQAVEVDEQEKAAQQVAEDAAKREAELRLSEEAAQKAADEEAAKQAAEEAAREESLRLEAEREAGQIKAEEAAQKATEEEAAKQAAEEAARQETLQAEREAEQRLRLAEEAERKAAEEEEAKLAAESAARQEALRQEAEREAEQRLAEEAARRAAEEEEAKLAAEELARQEALRQEAEREAEQRLAEETTRKAEDEEAAKQAAEEAATQEALRQEAEREAEQRLAEESARKAAAEEEAAKHAAEEAARQEALRQEAEKEAEQRRVEEVERKAAEEEAAKQAERMEQRLAEEEVVAHQNGFEASSHATSVSSEIQALRNEMQCLREKHAAEIASLTSEHSSKLNATNEEAAQAIQWVETELEASKKALAQSEESSKQLSARVESLQKYAETSPESSSAAPQETVSDIEDKLAKAQEDCLAHKAVASTAEATAAQAVAAAQESEQRASQALAEVHRLGAELKSALESQVAREEKTREDAHAWQSSLAATQQQMAALQQQREQEAVAANSQIEQVRSALNEADKQLRDKVDTLSRKEQEVKSLLRQLAAVGDARNSSNGDVAEASAAKSESTSFEVLFALEGHLGLEFQQLAAPYIVEKIHDSGVAFGLGIECGDELVAVADHPTTELPWENLVHLLRSRPVVARFLRDPERVKKLEQAQEGGFISSMFGAARKVDPRPVATTTAEQDPKLQLEVERLSTLLKARDEEVLELGGRLKQRDEALRILEAGSADAAGISGLAQEREALAQQTAHLQLRVEQSEQQSTALTAERDQLRAACVEETKQKEEFRQQACALNDRCTSLMQQFESLRSTCQHLSLDAQQKAGLETQVQELMKMNQHWQQAHQSLDQESQSLRSKAQQSQAMQSQNFERACAQLEERLRDREADLTLSQEQNILLQNERQNDFQTIQRLQSVIESIQETGESGYGHLEAELLERSRECTSLRRDCDEQRKRIQDLLDSHQDHRESIDQCRSLKVENESLVAQLASTKEENHKLGDVVERCVEKLEKESRERPHLVDKRMVTQMLAAYLEQRDHPRQAQEIMTKMADLLGFTSAEREQVGLNQRRRTVLEQEPASLADVADSFVDFLLEESET